MKSEVKRILVAVPQTAGDVFISTGLLPGIQKRWPHASIYFATESRYANILKGNPYIKKVVDYHKSMLNYRNYETWGPVRNTFDIVYHPSIVTQHIPHWIHGGHGDYLGHVYAHLCDLDRHEYGPQFIQLDPIGELPPTGKYITVHSKTNQDPKDYDYMQNVIDRIKDYMIVQIGGPTDTPLQNVHMDLRGKTTPQQLAFVLDNARLHIGLDSFPMHVAMHVETPSIIIFGGTYAKQGVNPAKADFITAIEPENRFLCPTSCHLIDCEMKKHGLDKCINNINTSVVINEIEKEIGKENIKQLDPVKLSAYMIIRDGIKYSFPFERSIEAAAQICDEVVVVDGGSTDGTLEKLEEIACNSVNFKVKIFRTEWDMDNPTLFGDEKTHARRCCEIGNYLIQFDADEIISEPYPGAIRKLIEENRDIQVIDLPVINFYGNDRTIRLEPASWKWRISKNDPNIVHGVHAEARAMDDKGRVIMDKRRSDSCEYIYADTCQIAKHKPVFDLQYEIKHQEARQDADKREIYAKFLTEFVRSNIVIFHYSWFDLNRKQKNGEFWDNTWHGKQKATHNTTDDIRKRVQEQQDILIEVDINHPLKQS
jgi:ADP-heptose:LPS heptosyltransferase/glycosyltransferase involved in cell wall biosynthesis